MKRLLVALVLLPVASTVTAASLCVPPEQVVFSCATRSAKLISLCVSASGVTYRFGSVGKVELDVRDPGPAHDAAFTYFHYFRAGADRSSVQIRTEQAQYTVFADVEQDQPPSAGVEVEVKGGRGRTVEIRCAGKPEAHWSRIEGRVACSADPLNACVEPARR